MTRPSYMSSCPTTMLVGTVPRSFPKDRFCPACGKKVSRYKNPRSRTTYCYACDDKRPWTHTMIAGKVVGDE